MKNKNVLLGVATAACLLTSPAFAAKTTLDNSDLGNVTAKANAYSFGSDSSMSILDMNGKTTSNASFGLYQWSDDHSTDTSTHKAANDQSGTKSNVQGTITAGVNSLTWGWISQNNLINSGTTTLTGAETNMAYGVTAVGGF